MLYLNECGIVCALGNTHSAIKQQLLDLAQSGVKPTEAWSAGRCLALGRVDAQVDAELPSMDAWPTAQLSRNNQMALAALAQIRPAVDAVIARFGSDRIGVVIGTSTSGIAGTESALRQFVVDGTFPADFHYGQQEMGSPASMLATELGVTGPAYAHSSACSSSAKALASAARLINMGLCDAVLCGGVDTLCAFTVAGFSALESVSVEQCNPLSANRNGINIGEGAALFLMTREPNLGATSVALCGWAETSDGYHISAPDPAGGGARLSMNQALQRAKLQPSQIDYINMHGTATRQNDAMEAKVIHELFGPDVAVSSTKSFTGHTLGAAAAIEAALCWLAMQDDNADGKLPPHLWDGVQDPTLPVLNVAAPGARLGRPIKWALSNSFAFGGSNATLILGRI
ncbi:beta-ketoacyl-ACP synthase [Solimicrobium silvestre]|uniref:3-oxoacyl-(Acyl-carrier-protein) synthase n=1 Tax=Solimicrobium silvestre TaxID=2099400 RepID=A0A2S9H5J3_9BURK|nr:beta-ketoacyl-ACP synthase [Solimicrobium silvestre]PRC95146.1 3-oxoacyl-(acyl-carrier-protein) synthase [Solimicrobium silvestre]